MSDTTQGEPQITRNRRPAIDREPVHEPVHEAPRTERRRRRAAAISEDRFYFPVEQIPEGSSYEWKRFSNKGEEDPFYIAAMREQGWEPVDPKRHVGYLPADYNKPNIIRDGLILMERPIELTQEARKEMKTLAKQQMREAEQRVLGRSTPDGTLTRDHPDLKPRLQKEWVRAMPIQED